MSAELNAAKEALEHVYPIVAIYGSARIKPGDRYYKETEALAKELSARGISVLSGGGPGLMEAANKGAQAGGFGQSVGLNITLSREPEPNEYQDLGVTFQHFASRKTAFCKYSQAFITMPGGYGTLDELFEILTLMQTGKSPVAPVILFGSEFWSGLVGWLNQNVMFRGLISMQDRKLITVVDSVEEAVLICEKAVTSSK